MAPREEKCNLRPPAQIRAKTLRGLLACRKIVENSDKFAKDEVHEWEENATSDTGEDSDDIENPADGVSVVENSLRALLVVMLETKSFSVVGTV